ncbi:MAG: methylated-DNA--[protein]-cysteine S-methyltransferase [Actinomycetota bacterium]|nr:methylated-DNA--[protein]-cysteine S-methyltransferase [Actinomycetota bacterium]
MNDRNEAPPGSASTDWERLRAGVIERAESEGLIDIAFETHDSPFGSILVGASREGVIRVALPAEDERAVLEDTAHRASARIARAARPSLTIARTQLDQYFEGVRHEFELDLDWGLTKGFRRDVLRQTANIAYGQTSSYAEMAGRAGRPAAVRAAGTALATNPLPILVPCHRVLRSDGSTGSYLGGPDMKVALLAMERRSKEG